MMNWKGFGRNCPGIIEVLNWRLPQRTAESHEETSVRIAGVSAEI
jgi:hypothetical protein